MKKWYNQKTFWTGLTMAVVAVVSLVAKRFSVAITLEEIALLETALGGVALIFLREAVNNGK